MKAQLRVTEVLREVVFSHDYVTLTTRTDGTATAPLPVSSRTGQDFWVRQTKAPAGYDLYKPSRTFTAKPGDPVTVTVTNTNTDNSTGTPPTPDPSDPGEPDGNESTPSPSTSHPAGGNTTSVADNPEPSSTPPAPAAEGALAHTGANATPWVVAGGALLLATGASAVAAARRRRTDNGGDGGPTEV